MKRPPKPSWGFKVTLDCSDMHPLYNSDLVFFEEFYGESVDDAWKDAVDCYKRIKSLEYVGYCSLD